MCTLCSHKLELGLASLGCGQARFGMDNPLRGPFGVGGQGMDKRASPVLRIAARLDHTLTHQVTHTSKRGLDTHLPPAHLATRLFNSKSKRRPASGLLSDYGYLGRRS